MILSVIVLNCLSPSFTKNIVLAEEEEGQEQVLGLTLLLISLDYPGALN